MSKISRSREQVAGRRPSEDELSTRPSNDANNKAAETITVVPITSNVTKIYPFEVFLDSKETGLLKASKVQCHQVKTISKRRINRLKPAGLVSLSTIQKINSALKLHLDLLT